MRRSDPPAIPNRSTLSRRSSLTTWPPARSSGCAVGSEAFPAVAAEGVLVLLICESGVGDPQAALQVCAAELVEATVGLGVDSRDEEASDGVDAAWVAADANEAFKAA